MTIESAWLIEHGESDVSRPSYWTGLRIVAWSCDPLQACRFARERDARTIADHQLAGVPVRVLEHIWAG